ncbi:50S ribosomal protein L25/general stress protein Ctc [Scytonema sp. UIC 10036]|uniref:50S ribosomal protein L25/general stress protein Ctc n=1 Tax=Scytonema sp. UIC 10036 TaxID=2304196 RepID=UPI0012DA265F|nr:50S ribosomal protein L25/general stress protein Ctc [Scytonema sp. UIC 10036]MUH00970.1 50S ribosomal protein L25/general stress protein Ctc [Scytonema sp. UIC 10036]
MELTIECQKRPDGSKPNALRRSGQIPANLYGHQGTESVALVLDAKVAERLLIKASINNSIVDLNVTDVPWRGKTLLREVQRHPAKGTVYHLSFFAVAGHGDTDVEVRLYLVGEPVGVKRDGGVLDVHITNLPLRCSPESIPEAIDIDISNLEVGDSLQVDQIPLPAGAKYMGEPGQSVLTILPPQRSSDSGTES